MERRRRRLRPSDSRDRDLRQRDRQIEPDIGQPRHATPPSRPVALNSERTGASAPQEEPPMARIDWSVLSGPRVSRRTLLSLAAASGATGYASRLAASAAPIPMTPTVRRAQAQGDPKPGG